MILTLRQVFDAMLYGPPKSEGFMKKREWNEKKGRYIVGSACAIGRASLNLGLMSWEDEHDGKAWKLADALSREFGGLGNNIMSENDSSDVSIEKMVEGYKKRYGSELDIQFEV